MLTAEFILAIGALIAGFSAFLLALLTNRTAAKKDEVVGLNNVITTLQKENKRLNRRVELLENEKRTALISSQTRVAELMARIHLLEDQIRAAGGTPIDWKREER